MKKLIKQEQRGSNTRQSITRKGGIITSITVLNDAVSRAGRKQIL